MEVISGCYPIVVTVKNKCFLGLGKSSQTTFLIWKYVFQNYENHYEVIHAYNRKI